MHLLVSEQYIDSIKHGATIKVTIYLLISLDENQHGNISLKY